MHRRLGLALSAVPFSAPVLGAQTVSYSQVGLESTGLSGLTSWTPVTHEYLGSAEWRSFGGEAGVDVPDLTSTGGLIEFGFRWDVADIECASNASSCFDAVVDIGVDNFAVRAFAERPTTVPEPASCALLAAGLAGLGVMARRRRLMA
jgi:hypothetical protein